MNKFKISILGTMMAFSLNHVTHALTAPTNFTSTGSNLFIFFENNVDNEYFIASDVLNPRFSGANTWTKYGSNNQDSLGYMGRDTGVTSGYNVDLWLEGSGMLTPFQGLRCRIRRDNECPSTGFVAPAFVDQYGAYKMVAGSTEYTGNAVRGSFSPQAYEYLKNLPIGATDIYNMHYCYTREDYNPAAGQKCQDAATGTWRKLQITTTKAAHIKFKDNKAFSEIWVATDGTPSLTSNNDACEYIVIANSNNATTQELNEGIACKMVAYELDGPPSAFNTSTRLYMVIDTTALNNMTIADTAIMINGGASSTWARWNGTGRAENRMSNLMATGNNDIRVLFTKRFFKNMLAAGASTSGRQGVFTFAVNNTVTPQSGFYQFATNMDIDIIPREYGISIRHKNQDERVKTGKIGEEEEAITFDYVVTQSAPRKADTVKASVIGNSVTVRSNSYCLFKSTDSTLNVAIPSYLSFTHETGGNVEQYSGCNANAELDLTKAQWSATPWDEQQSGYFYSTDLKLRFPMNDPVSLFTTDGIDWLGTVRAEGDVKVEATWIGVTP